MFEMSFHELLACGGGADAARSTAIDLELSKKTLVEKLMASVWVDFLIALHF